MYANVSSLLTYACHLLLCLSWLVFIGFVSHLIVVVLACDSLSQSDDFSVFWGQRLYTCAHLNNAGS